MILALDVATETGYAHAPAGAAASAMEWGVRRFVAPSNGQVISMFRAWLVEICRRVRPTLIVREAPYIPLPRAQFRTSSAPPPPQMNPVVLRRLLGMNGQVDAVCWEFGIELREVVSSAFTKYLTGKGQWPGGRAEKKRKVVEACQSYGCDPHGNDNAADALAIWFYMESLVAEAASETRKRLAADRDRTLYGIGGLFAPENTERPAGHQPQGVQVTTFTGEANNGNGRSSSSRVE